MGAQPPPHPHIHYAGGCCPLLVGWSAATMLTGSPVQAIPYRGRCVAAAVVFCLCFLSLLTEKCFKLKVIKNFAVFDYF